MADTADDALDMQEAHLDASLRAARPVTPAAAGGTCETCELPSPALFGGECAWCHDGRERPEEQQPEPAFKIASARVAPAAAPTMKRLPTAPGKGMGQGFKPALVAGRGDRRQLNVHFPADRYAEVERRAAEKGLAPSAWARTIFMTELDGSPSPAFEKGRKPFIPAEVIRAARDASQPLDVYVTALIARGFMALQREASR